MSKPKDPLSKREELFVSAYLACGCNGAKAHALVFGTEDSGAAASRAYEMVHRPRVKAEIERRLEANAMSAAEVISRLSVHARGDLSRYLTIERDDKTGAYDVAFDLDACTRAGDGHLIKEVKLTPGGMLVVKIHDAQAALDKLARVHGLYKDSLDVTGTMSLDDGLAALAKARGADKVTEFKARRGKADDE